MISNKTSKFLRMIAILMVIASHYAEWMYVEPIHPGLKAWVSELGPYGVDIFLLLSGYGIYKSAVKQEKVDWRFVIRRIESTYIPYLILVICIDALSGTLFSLDSRGWMRLLQGYDFWYMNVLFIFYILFILIWQMNRIMRLPLITIAVIGVSISMFRLGRLDFWYISNLSFLVGIYAAALEKRWKGFVERKIPLILSFVALFLFIFTKSEAWIMNLLFSIGVVGIAYYIPQWKYLPTRIGENSLFIYILHQYLFWQFTIVWGKYSYPKMAVMIGITTIIICVIVGMFYQSIIKILREKTYEKL